MRVSRILALTAQMMAMVLSILTVVVLLGFNLRRLAFALTILRPRRRRPVTSGRIAERRCWPEVVILVPCHDEERVIEGLCRSVERLDYPDDKRHIVLIDDHSSDSTHGRMDRFATGRRGWHVLGLSANVGKAASLNAALERFGVGELVYVLDADHRPEPDALKRLVRLFDDPRVAGASGRTVPMNPLASPSAYYSTVENYVHQLVTMRAKDWLALGPALLGSNCAYRRTALVACGGFWGGAFLEDTDMTLAFYRAGYRVRFEESAIAHQQVPVTVQSYLTQHARWARGFNDVARTHARDLLRSKHLPFPLRIELTLFAAGYLDRLALIAAGALTLLSILSPRRYPFPRLILVVAFLTPLVQIVAVLAEQRVAGAMWLRLLLVPGFFFLDVVAAARGMRDSLRNRSRVWARTPRE